MIVGRLLLRLLLVPLGAGVAICVAVLVAAAAHWNRLAALVAADAGNDDLIIALLVAGPWVAFVLSVSAMAMMLPALIGVLLAEAFAIRSWIFHAANGALSAWVGRATLVEMQAPYDFYDEPLVVVAAGIAAGLAYWAVAGWSAGFWKPVFAREQEAAAASD